MNYRTSVLRIDPQFPFSIYNGSGWSVHQYENGDSRMHRHQSLKINSVLRGSGRHKIGDQSYLIQPGDLFIINDLEYHQSINESRDMLKVSDAFRADISA